MHQTLGVVIKKHDIGEADRFLRFLPGTSARLKRRQGASGRLKRNCSAIPSCFVTAILCSATAGRDRF